MLEKLFFWQTTEEKRGARQEKVVFFCSRKSR